MTTKTIKVAEATNTTPSGANSASQQDAKEALEKKHEGT